MSLVVPTAVYLVLDHGGKIMYGHGHSLVLTN
jgi:hypothetical protein